MRRSSLFARVRKLGLVGAAIALAVAATPGRALAQDCDLETGEVLYIAGPDSMINVLRGIAAALWTEDTHVFYKGYPSCLGTIGIVNNDPTTPDPDEIGGDAAHAVTFWPGDPEAPMSCQLPYDMEDEAEPEIPADIVLSDVFPTTCASFPNGLGSVTDFQGPALGFGFIVHPDSVAESISAEAAYLVYGFGGVDKVVPPWTNTDTIFHRDPNSGTENIFAKTIGLDVTRWTGTSVNSTSVLLSSVAEATDEAVDTAIGGAGLSILDQRREDLRVLPYQHYEQTCGYYPDSTEAALDKRNIRDGHYPIWGVVHILTRTDGAGIPVKDGANRFINLVLGTAEIADLDPIALEADSGLIPQCAMRVIREEDGGPLASYQPDRACGCYYESLVGESDCEECTTSASCPDEAPNCSYGFCEP